MEHPDLFLASLEMFSLCTNKEDLDEAKRKIREAKEETMEWKNMYIPCPRCTGKADPRDRNLVVLKRRNEGDDAPVIIFEGFCVKCGAYVKVSGTSKQSELHPRHGKE